MKIPQLWQDEIDKGSAFGQRVLKTIAAKQSSPRVVKPPRHRERVGTALKTRIEKLITIKTGKGCGCQNLAAEMDAWGIAGCQQRREHIIGHLVGNRSVLVDALKWTGFLGHAVGLAIEFIPDVMLRAGAATLLDQAIADARVQPVHVPRPRRERTVSATGMKRFVGNLKAEQDRLHAANQAASPPPPDPFAGQPVLHFGAHLWPIPGHWEWHVDRWNEVAKQINGRCIVGVATGGGSVGFADVRARLDARFEAFEFQNTGEGENHTFRELQRMAPGGQNDVLIYCHGKGVRQHTKDAESVRVWTELMYETVIFNTARIVERLAAGYQNFHSFRTFGTRPLSPKYKWHPSGTFFAVRAKYLAGKPVKSRYGGVEAWCGDHFAAADSWCEFGDNAMFTVMYDLGSIYATHVDPGMDWEAARIGGPRCEQHKRELDWFLEWLNPTDRILVIGSKHGGLEAAIKRRLPDVTTVSIDIAPQADNTTTDLIVGSSHDNATHAAARAQGPYDVVFIDGDHSYVGAQHDYWFAQSLNPRLIALHDIHDTHKHRSEGCEVARLWNEIKQAGRRTEEKIVGMGWGGIGVVWRDRNARGSV